MKQPSESSISEILLLSSADAVRPAPAPATTIPVVTGSLGFVSTYMLTAWHYRLRLRLEGSETRNLPDALEAEDLALFETIDRDEVNRQIRDGLLTYDATYEGPRPSFPEDLAILSAYLFRIVKGLEVAERFVEGLRSDDARAWKVVARSGEWVKFPLVVTRAEDGSFHMDEDADDLEVLAARWTSYPGWFQDGMRRKHPSLRRL